MRLDNDSYYKWIRWPTILALAPLLAMSRRRPATLFETTDYKKLLDTRPHLTPSQANEFIREMVSGNTPGIVGRVGSTELRGLIKFQAYGSRDWVERIWAMSTRHYPLRFNVRSFERLRSHSGVFPLTAESMQAFFLELEAALREVDLLASWVPGENKAFRNQELLVTELSSISPLVHPHPWTSGLAGRQVLLVHPFKRTIQAQWRRRTKLFENPEVLPEFDLKLVEAPQTLGGYSQAFSSWSEALEETHRRIRTVCFDVALVGCGSYSLPLARRIKASGRPVVVLGGELQLLFGIKGKRWDGSQLYNSAWVRPLEADRPRGFQGADNGAYW